MSSKKTVLYITEDRIRLLSGPWPNLSVCAQKQRSSIHDLGDDISMLVSGIQLKDRSCVLLVSRRDSVLKILSFPSSDPREIQRMAALQVPVVVPFDTAQVMHKSRTLATSESGYSDVLLTLVPSAFIEKYLDATDAAGLTVKDVYVSFDSLAQFGNKFLRPQWNSKKCGAVVVCDRFFSDMIFFQDQRVVFSYHLSFGLEDVAGKGKEFADAIAAGVRDYQKSDFGKEIEIIYFNAGAPGIDAVITHLRNFEQWELAKLDILAKVPDTVKAFMAKHGIDQTWAPLLGCFDQEDKKVFHSFLPAKIHFSKAKKQSRKVLANFAAACVLMIALIVGLCQTILYKHEQYLHEVNQRIEALSPKLKTLESKVKFLNTMIPQGKEGHTVVGMIKEIYELFPQQATIQFFSMRPPAVFEIQGMAWEDHDISAFQSALLESPSFQNVDLKYTTKRKRFKETYTEFKISLEAVE